MYALGKSHPLKERCRDILQKIVHDEIMANIDTEVLQELLYVYSARGEREKAIRVVEETLIIFPNPYDIKREEIEKAKDLMKKYKVLIPRDAIHCAVAINYKLDGIISTDKDLAPVKETHIFQP